ncbi:MAG TPA: MFS transporter, partial [Bacteroidales bacterium]|nr:MFS transporter [Bacteroidales bacterium]
LYIPAGLALIADYHRGNTRSLAVGIHMTGLYVGQALGGFGATVAHAWSWQITFQSFGLIGVLYSIILIFFLNEKRDTPVPEVKTIKSGNILDSVKNSLGMLLGMISFWVILFYFAVPSLPGWAVKNWMPTLFAETLGLDMSIAGPLCTITIASSSFLGVIAGGIVADRWISHNLRGRIYTGAIGLSLTIPAILLVGFSSGITGIMAGGIVFGIGFGMFDSNNMPILCQFVSPRQRAAGYGLMNLTGVFAGALVTGWLGKSTDAGNLGRDMALLAIPVVVAVVLLLVTLKPVVTDKVSD